MEMIVENLKLYIVQQLSTNGVIIFRKIVIAIFVFVVVYVIIKRIISFTKNKIEVNHLGNHNDIKKVSGLISNVLFIVLSIFNFLIFLQILGLDVALLMGGVSLGLAFALETVIANMIAGIMIVMNKKFTIGDLISIEGDVGMTGYIENITLRYTVVKTFDRRKTIIPNTKLSENPFKTIKSEKYIRGEISIHTPRHIEISQIKELINNTINQNENIVQQDFTNTIISGFDEKGILFKGFFLVDPKISSTGFVTKTQLKKSLHLIFKQYGIRIPYVHVTIEN